MMYGTNTGLFAPMSIPRMWLAGIYARLSKDDELQGESNSITNQRELLTAVCEEQGWTIVKVYQDDGYTGLNTDRPGLQEMLRDVKAGKINLVITKDLSRLGRNYLDTGDMIEKFFPRHRCRYIAYNDGIDTNSDANDILPFKNVLNELYSKDISKKVHASYLVAARKGSYTGVVAPFGYLKDPDVKGHLIVDPETGDIVRNIFRLAAEGRGPNHIRRWCEVNKIPCPAWWNRQRGVKRPLTKWEKKYPENGHLMWDLSYIKDILINPVYYGAIASQKRYYQFKMGTIGDKKPDEWIIVEDCHEPLVDKATFLIVQEKLKSRQRVHKDGSYSLFAGLIKCGECGKSLTYGAPRAHEPEPVYRCKTYQTFGKNHCTQHRVQLNMLTEKVLGAIRACASAVQVDADDVQRQLEEAQAKRDNVQQDNLEASIQRDEDRLNLLQKMLTQLYEDRMLGNITEENFSMLMQKTQAEQKELETRIAAAKEQLAGTKKNDFDTQQWVDLISQYADIEELDSETLNRLVRKIIVHETIDEDHVRHIRMEIHFNFQPVPTVEEYQPAQQRPYFHPTHDEKYLAE